MSRGEDTRLRILAAAVEMFATTGYEGTTTRRLADIARVNLPAIQYYFGNKDGLHRAVVAHLIDTMDRRVGPAADQVAARLAGPALPRAELVELLCLMLNTFAALVTDRSVPDWKSRAMFFARAEIEPSATLDPMHEWAMRRIIRPCAAIVGTLLGDGADEEAVLLRTLAVLGQILIFCNQKGPKTMGWADVSAERVGAIQSIVCEHARAIFRAAAEFDPQELPA
jgi:AcrR family transcriptional regulator